MYFRDIRLHELLYVSRDILENSFSEISRPTPEIFSRNFSRYIQIMYFKRLMIWRFSSRVEISTWYTELEKIAII